MKDSIWVLNKGISMLKFSNKSYLGKWIGKYKICDWDGKNVSDKYHYQITGDNEQFNNIKNAQKYIKNLK